MKRADKAVKKELEEDDEPLLSGTQFFFLFIFLSLE